ncbi:MAG: tyrosine-type recombinase/integrase [Acidobacteriota bacterium]
MKARVQHPKIHEGIKSRQDGWWWFFRYWADQVQPGGSIKQVRIRQWIGPSRGEQKLSKKQAEVERDKFLARLNRPTIQEKIADGMILFSKFVEKFVAAHVTAQAARRFHLAKPTRDKYLLHLEHRILPNGVGRQLSEIKPDEVQQWLFETSDSWHMMSDLRGLMSAIDAKAEEWGYWPEGRRNPISRVKIGRKWHLRPSRIPTDEETVRILARLEEPNLLVIETAIARGGRISEILGLKWGHFDLDAGVIHIVQRNWRGDIAAPKSESSRRPLALGHLVDRCRAKAKADNAQPEKWVFVRNDGSGLPLWDSGVRQALNKAATAEGCDLPGLGPHSFRRANITWRQEVGGSAIEASKIAGHSDLRTTEDYTQVQLTRQGELTRRIQQQSAAAAKKTEAAEQPAPAATPQEGGAAAPLPTWRTPSPRRRCYSSSVPIDARPAPSRCRPSSSTTARTSR